MGLQSALTAGGNIRQQSKRDDKTEITVSN